MTTSQVPTGATVPRGPDEIAVAVGRLVDEVVRPGAAAMARGEGMHPAALVAEAGRRGLAGLVIPREHGGAGATHVDLARLIESVARACASSSVILDVHESVGSETIVMFGDERQRAAYLPRLASGEWTAGFALTEPSGGSDAASLQTRAVRDGDVYRLRGAKAFITNVGAAHLYTVMARTGEGASGISAFIVEAASPGVRAGTPLGKMGLHGSWTGDLFLDDVAVPVTNRLGKEGIGFQVAMAALDSGRIGISAQAVGIAQGALDAAVAHARAHGGTADTAALADMAVRVEAARALTLHAARLVDAGEPVTREASVAKLYATDACVAVAHAAIELCAPDSQADDHPAAIRLRDAKACQIYEGTNQIQRVVVARELLRSTRV